MGPTNSFELLGIDGARWLIYILFAVGGLMGLKFFVSLLQFGRILPIYKRRAILREGIPTALLLVPALILSGTLSGTSPRAMVYVANPSSEVGTLEVAGAAFEIPPFKWKKIIVRSHDARMPIKGSLNATAVFDTTIDGGTYIALLSADQYLASKEIYYVNPAALGAQVDRKPIVKVLTKPGIDFISGVADARVYPFGERAGSSLRSRSDVEVSYELNYLTQEELRVQQREDSIRAAATPVPNPNDPKANQAAGERIGKALKSTEQAEKDEAAAQKTIQGSKDVMQSMKDWEKQQKEFDASLQHLKDTRAGMQKTKAPNSAATKDSLSQK